jgi:hypothetical protein
MSELTKSILVMLAALLAGYASLELASGPDGLAAVKNGPWRVWPLAGARDGSLYARYHHLRRGELPLSRFLGIRLQAETDDAGRPLRGHCRYVISGPMPPARLWTLALHRAGAGADPGEEEGNRIWLASEDALPDAGGRLHVVIDPRLRPGSWLRPPDAEGGEFVIVLRLYGISPLQRDRLHERLSLSVRREGC